MYTLYTLPGTCSTGISVLMQKLGLDYTSINRNDVENYTDIVPTNQVPAIRLEDGTVIAEGGAIALFLLEKHGADLLPKDVTKRAEFYQWLNFDYATLHPAYSKVFAVLKSDILPDADKAKMAQYMADKLSQTWEILDKRLAGSRYILGDTPTHADYMAAIYTSWSHFMPSVTIKLGEHVKRFAADVSSLPEFKAGYEKDGAEFKPTP